MNTKKLIARMLAVVLAAAMLVSMTACGISSHNEDPIVVSSGKGDVGINQVVEAAYQYYLYGSQYPQLYGLTEAPTFDQVVEYAISVASERAVQLDNAYKAGMTYDSLSDEAKADIESSLAEYMESDPDADRDMYFDILVENAILTQLRENDIVDITVDNDDVVERYESSVSSASSMTAASFKSSFENFIKGNSTTAPYFMPHPENVEDDEDTEDVDESAEAQYAAIFSVFQFQILYTGEHTEDVDDYYEYLNAVETDDDGNETYVEQDALDTIRAIEARMSSLTYEDFLRIYCFNPDLNYEGDDEAEPAIPDMGDPNMAMSCFQYFGLLMQEDFADADSTVYDPGFAYAAMKLMYPEWERKVEEADDEADTDGTDADTDANDAETDDAETDDADEPEAERPGTLVDKARYEELTLRDGTRVMKVISKEGVHYIVLNNNDCYSMYYDGEGIDENDGKLIVPLYDKENIDDEEYSLIMGGDMITTCIEGVTITQEQLDAIRATLSHVGSDEEDEDDAEDTDAEDTDAEDTDAGDTDAGDEAEEPKDMIKDFYSNIYSSALSAAQNERWTNTTTAWMDQAKISIRESVIKNYIELYWSGWTSN